ncbi:MAG: Asp-tRNA(Asn)/Glu-tRNA(Gln) amidotransferase subunit GatA [Planctomycetota bacterium]
MSAIHMDLPAREIVAAVKAGNCTATDICAAALARITRINPDLRAFLEVTAQEAQQQAQNVDVALADRQSPGELAGVPLAIKDNICTTFGHTTCASQSLQGYVSPYNATVIERISAAGGVIVGKTNLDEFAMGSSNENSSFFPTGNPWNPDHVPGGSSGGSAAAVASGMVPLALGSDTGGSIRQPAAFCGIVGLKPTYGRVSRYGLVAYGSSLEQIGPLARNVEDVALLLHVISGYDPHDSTCVDRPVPDYPAALSTEELAACAARLTIGVPREYFAAGLDDEVRAAVEEAIAVYRRLGARIIEVSLPHTPACIAVYYVVAMAECSSNLARFDGVHYGRRGSSPDNLLDLYCSSRDEGFGSEVKRHLMLGNYVLSSGYYDAYYLKALRVRRLIKQDFERAFTQADLLICPTTPTPAFRRGEKLGNPLQMYLADIYTVSANLAGIPGISIPCGLASSGLPIGLQLMGPVFSEQLLLQAARLYERETDWHTRRPPNYCQGARHDQD